MSELRVVLDTSCLISYIITQGDIMRQVMDAWDNDVFTVVSSPQLLEELARVLRRPRIQQRAQVSPQWFVNHVATYASFMPGIVEVESVCRDPKDDKFLACTVEGKADYLVSSDKDLLVIGRYENVCVLNPGQFLAALRMATLSAAEVRAEFTVEALRTIHAELCLDAVTGRKVAQAISA